MTTTASIYQTAASFSYNFVLNFLNRYVLLYTLADTL
jgi:hypothetical protein